MRSSSPNYLTPAPDYVCLAAAQLSDTMLSHPSVWSHSVLPFCPVLAAKQSILQLAALTSCVTCQRCTSLIFMGFSKDCDYAAAVALLPEVSAVQ